MFPIRHFLIIASASVFAAACASRPLPKYEKPLARASVQQVRTTAYTHTESDHRRHGRRTAMGTTLRYGAVKSAAADWSRWPAGTIFRIRETGETCEVDDYGWALAGTNTIDLYKPSRGAMNNWGVRRVSIEILRWGDPWASYAKLKPRTQHRHVRRMVEQIQDRFRRNHRPPEPVFAPSEGKPRFASAEPSQPSRDVTVTRATRPGRTPFFE
jgi:3D (Asp-Asp-Asp) domain-containing protein